MNLDAVHENVLLSRWGALLQRPPRQLGAIHQADAELVPLGDGRWLAATVDQVAEEVRTGLYRDPETVGRVAATAALSDLAAVGADPLGVLLAVTLPHGHREPAQRAIAKGVADVMSRAGTFVLGGDTSEGPDLSVTCTALGTVPDGQAMLRVGAQPGDHLMATGRFGLGAALGARALLGVAISLDEAEFRPAPRLREAQIIRRFASACIDTSDGLVAALDQLSRDNGAAFTVDAPIDALLHPAAQAAASALGVGASVLLGACHGEFELVFTVPEARIETWRRASADAEVVAIELGRVTRGRGIVLGEREIDGAAVRNALEDCGGDLQRYFRALCRLCG